MRLPERFVSSSQTQRPQSMARGDRIIHAAGLHRESIASGCYPPLSYFDDGALFAFKSCCRTFCSFIAYQLIASVNCFANLRSSR